MWKFPASGSKIPEAEEVYQLYQKKESRHQNSPVQPESGPEQHVALTRSPHLGPQTSGAQRTADHPVHGAGEGQSWRRQQSELKRQANYHHQEGTESWSRW